DHCRQLAIDWVVLGGFLKRLTIPPDFTHRVVNIHPSLIPAFCGQGFYGSKVHRAVLDYGCKLSGCTVHFVDDLYDHGPIIAQVSVPVKHDDTVESLAARVFVQECELYPRVLNQLAKDCIRVEGRHTVINHLPEPFKEM
ncbi:MAG TPA: formyltransferase family protein, partial [Pirellulaceae bacterium]|nr:formyltransferase family protein [Pirellulaceae bacterium]